MAGKTEITIEELRPIIGYAKEIAAALVKMRDAGKLRAPDLSKILAKLAKINSTIKTAEDLSKIVSEVETDISKYHKQLDAACGEISKKIETSKLRETMVCLSKNDRKKLSSATQKLLNEEVGFKALWAMVKNNVPGQRLKDMCKAVDKLIETKKKAAK